MSATEDKLTITIEDKITGFLWNNTFNASHIEAITEETGNPKKFETFIKMLDLAFTNETGFLYLDIVTPSDIEAIKNRKKRKESSNEVQNPDAKRYLILTHIIDFEKTSFPLPLNLDENSDPETLKEIISHMRAQIEELKNRKTTRPSEFATKYNPNNSFTNQEFMDSPDFRNIKSENEMLKDKCKKFEEALGLIVSKNKSIGAFEFDLLLKSKLDLENELDFVKKEHQKEVKSLNEKIDELYKELGGARMEVNQLRSQMAGMRENGGAAQSTRRNLLVQSEEDLIGLSMSKTIISHHKKQIEQLTNELNDLKSIESKQRVRIRQLEKELESALRRMIKSQSAHQAKKKAPFNTNQQEYEREEPNKKKPAIPTISTQKSSEEKMRPEIRSPQISPKTTGLNFRKNANLRVISARPKNPYQKIASHKHTISVYGGMKEPDVQSPGQHHVDLASKWLNTMNSATSIQIASPKTSVVKRFPHDFTENDMASPSSYLQTTQSAGLHPLHRKAQSKPDIFFNRNKLSDNTGNYMKMSTLKQTNVMDQMSMSDSSIDLHDIDDRIGKL